MRFWDASAIVPCLVVETSTPYCRQLLKEDARIVVWTFTTTEIWSALYRKYRHDTTMPIPAIRARLQCLEKSWHEVIDIARVKLRAERLLATHGLRTGDALQLAAALIACHEMPDQLPFVTFDDRLAQSALREGFTVIDASRAK